MKKREKAEGRPKKQSRTENREAFGLQGLLTIPGKRLLVQYGRKMKK